jgi:hypothetical protein
MAEKRRLRMQDIQENRMRMKLVAQLQNYKVLEKHAKKDALKNRLNSVSKSLTMEKVKI